MGDFPKVKKGQAVHRLNEDTKLYDVGIVDRAFDDGFILDLGDKRYMYSKSFWNEEVEKLLLFETKKGKPVVNRGIDKFVPYFLVLAVGFVIGVIVG